MNYKVFYRKYRPVDFTKIVSQDHIIETLKNAVINDKIAHAYLFSGPRGTGKTTTARVFAKTVNCLNPNNGIACNSCTACEAFLSSPDIIEIDAASNNGVDEIRELNNNVKILPSELKYKIYIVDEVHMLTTSAFNALLLTLEEPPSHTIFILATTNAENIPLTILSRCQRFDFKKINQKDLTNEIFDICQKEKIKISPEAIEEIAFLSEGSLRDALSLLDQASSSKKIELETITNLVGNVSLKDTKLLISALVSGDKEEIINIINDLKNRGIDNKLLVKSLIKELVKTIELAVNSKNINCNVKSLKKIIMDLVDYLNKINIYVDPFDILKVLFLSHLSEEEPEEFEKDSNAAKKTQNTIEKKDTTNENDCLREIRINNCFALAKKKNKLESHKIWLEFIESLENNYKGFLVDTGVVLASEDIMLVNSDLKYNVDVMREKSEQISLTFADFSKNAKKIVFVTSEEWEKLSKEYIKKTKKGEKYALIDEVCVENELEKIANGIFNKVKIEEDK